MANPFAPRFFKCTSKSEIAAGVTPEILDAWPKCFRTLLVEFLAHFDRQRGDVEVIEALRQLQVFVVVVAFDFLGLAVDVAGILELDLDLLAHRAIVDAGTGQRLASTPAMLISLS